MEKSGRGYKFHPFQVFQWNSHNNVYFMYFSYNFIVLFGKYILQTINFEITKYNLMPIIFFYFELFDFETCVLFQEKTLVGT